MCKWETQLCKNRQKVKREYCVGVQWRTYITKDAKSWVQGEIEWVHEGLTDQAETPTLGEPTTQETVRSLENMWEKYDASLLCSHSSSGIHLESWTRCWARQMCGPAQSCHSNFTEALPHTWRDVQHSVWAAPWKPQLLTPARMYMQGLACQFIPAFNFI